MHAHEESDRDWEIPVWILRLQERERGGEKKNKRAFRYNKYSFKRAILRVLFFYLSFFFRVVRNKARKKREREGEFVACFACCFLRARADYESKRKTAARGLAVVFKQSCGINMQRAEQQSRPELCFMPRRRILRALIEVLFRPGVFFHNLWS